ncbi:hypothetical protein [Shewanella sp.]
MFAGEEQSASYDDIMPIANIAKEHLPLVDALPRNVTFIVEAAE